MRILRPKIHTRKLAQRNNSFRYSGRIQCKGQQFFCFLIIERSFDSRIPFIALLNRRQCLPEIKPKQPAK